MKRALGGVLVLACLLLGAGCGSDDDDGGRNSDSCRAGCEQVMAANCDNGPATQSQCESDCSVLASGSCGTQYKALQACAEGKAVTCSSAGLPTISACADESSAFVSCIN